MLQRKRAHSKSRIKFSLEKYYLDLVTVDGQYFVGYSALLNLGSVKFNYSATLHDPAMSGIITGPVLSTRSAPVTDECALTWRSPRLGVDGRWRPLADTETLMLHETDNGFVEWNCQQPAARVQLRTGSGMTYDGLGYVERLNLTIRPWQLGLQNLFWGRFVSEEHSVVWIEWQGDYALTVLILNGKKISNSRISENGVKCDDFELTLERHATIRKGSLGETFVSKIPAALKIAPIDFLGGSEEKFLSRGQLRFVDGSQSTGWVIHERVSWRKNQT